MLVLKSKMACFKFGVLGCDLGVGRWIFVGTSVRSAWISEFYSSNRMDNYVP